MSAIDVADMVSRYSALYSKHGYSPQSLDWGKGRQDIRFEVLLDYFDCSSQRILDMGCGFGDLNRVLTRSYGTSYDYMGIDLVDDFLIEARQRYGRERVDFVKGDFLEMGTDGHFDIVVGSGIFNYKFSESSNAEFIEQVMLNAARTCRQGFAFDFLSDKVDFRLPHTWHANPAVILDIAYGISRNVVLRNDYIPFEFSVCVYMDDHFSPDEVVFERYKRARDQRQSAGQPGGTQW